MFDRFSGRARKVMSVARLEAQHFNHEYIGTEHILLAILKEGSGAAAATLRSLGVDTQDVVAGIEKIVRYGPSTVTMGQLPFTPRVKKVLECALSEASRLGHAHLGTEHLLLGLVAEGDGIAAQVLVGRGLSLEGLRKSVLEHLESETAPMPARERPKISACIITLNEEANLPACLESVKFADEIVVLDSGSMDRTREIAEKAGARIFVEPFAGHIEQKNRAIDLASNQWVLCLDADERVTSELAYMIDFMDDRVTDQFDGFEIPRRNYYMGRWMKHGGWYPDAKIRLFRKDRGLWGGVNPHDRVIVQGRVERLRGDLIHTSYRDLSHHARTIDSFTTIMARERGKRGKPFSLFRLLFEPAARFVRMYVLQRGFLDGMPGFIAAWNASYYVFLRHAKQYETERAGAAAGKPTP